MSLFSIVNFANCRIVKIRTHLEQALSTTKHGRFALFSRLVDYFSRGQKFDKVGYFGLIDRR